MTFYLDDIPDSIRCNFRNNFCGWMYNSTDGASEAKILHSNVTGPVLGFRKGRLVSPPLPKVNNQKCLVSKL